MAYDRDRWEPDLDHEDEPVYSEDDDGSARSLRRYLDFAAVPEPSSLWGSLVKSGYQIVYGLEVDGIPYLFGERELWTTRGAAAASRNADDFTMSYSLVIDEGTAFSVECDREKGVASGRAVEFVFGRQQLADEGLGAAIFARPTLRANLTSTINDPADDTLDVDSTSGWDATGLLYVGRECVRYTSTTATQFGGCQRGVAGYPHYHTANTSGGYRQCTDTPVFWRGRLVTVWAHLCGPDGRFLGQRWCAHGEWCRQEWRGYVRDAPRPAAGGMVLACLPLVRLAAQEVGAEISGRMLPDWIVAEESDTVTILGSSTVEVPGRAVGGTSGIVSLDAWCLIAARAANADLTEDVTITRRKDSVRFGFNSGAAGYEALVAPQAWFLDSSREYITLASPSTITGTYVDVPLAWADVFAVGAWVVVEIDPDADASDADIGTEGYVLLESPDGRTIVSYNQTRSTSDGAKRAFRISGYSSAWNPWKSDTTVRVIGGVDGSWGKIFKTLMTSSGTGERGAFDTLPVGFGAGVPASWVNPAADRVTTDTRIIGSTTGRTSAEDLLGGWLVLRRECLVQRRQDDGAVTFDVVSTDVVDDPDALTLTDADVLMDGHDSPELVEAPNHVRVRTSDSAWERPLVVVRDSVRAQAEGVRALDVNAPGLRREDVLEAAGELLLLGDGQSAVRLRLPPWVEVQIGAAVDVTSAHPAIWSWSTGTYAPSTVLGRVVAWSRVAWSQVQEVTILLAGQAQERFFLAPSAFIEQGVSTTVYRVRKGDALGFAVGDEVRVYAVSNEGASSGVVTLTAIDETSDAYDLFTFDGNPGVSSTYERWVTFADYASCVTRQQRFLFVRDASDWR